MVEVEFYAPSIRRLQDESRNMLSKGCYVHADCCMKRGGKSECRNVESPERYINFTSVHKIAGHEPRSAFD